MTQHELNELTSTIIGAAIEVHKELGPGLLEGLYEKCLVFLLKEKGLQIITQQKIPVQFRGLRLDYDLRFDIMVEDVILILLCLLYLLW